MRRIVISERYNFVKILALCILLMQVVNGFPTTRTEKSIESEEKQFPNGTVIGKYAYLDKEGNPVQVKYYADDSSYGVELNSFRVVTNKDKDSQPAASPQIESLIKKPDETLPNLPAKEGNPETLPKSGGNGASGSFDFVDSFKYPAPMSNSNKFISAKSDYPELIHKEEKVMHQKSKYKSPDYEVYAKNDVESLPQCGTTNEKVRVYNFVKEARKTREVPEEEQFCEF